ncbi:MAG: hypothetical protein AAGA87_15585 [Pseudomonadota bacterium]
MRYIPLILLVLAAALPAQAKDPLAESLQIELNRLGCEAGTPDGLWGRGSKRALAT